MRWPRWDRDHRHQYEQARLRLNFPLFVGKKWRETYSATSVEGRNYHYANKYKVAKINSIKTKAGKFKAFQIRKTHKITDGSKVHTENYYYAPDVKTIVRSKPSWRYGRELLNYELADGSQTTKSDPAKADAFHVIFASGLTERKRPKDDLAEASLQGTQLFLYVKWRFPLDQQKSFLVSYRVYDGTGNQIHLTDSNQWPKNEYWDTWESFYLSPKYAPGRWKAEIDLDGEKIAEKYIEISAE